MKLPASQLNDQELEYLFKKSSIVKQHFFPRKVPSIPPFSNTISKEKVNLDTSTATQRKIHEKPVENN